MLLLALFGAGKIVSFGSYNSGYGSGARLQTTSESWVNLEINGTNQASLWSNYKKF